MSDSSPLTMNLSDFLELGKERTKERAIQLDTLGKTRKKEQGIFFWLRDAFNELTDLYMALDTLYQFMQFNDGITVQLMKNFLGLKEKASPKEIETRAKEFGEFVEILLKKAKEWADEDKLKKSMR